MPLTWLDKQPCPLPKDKRVALSLCTVIISASKTCQLSFPPHQTLLRRETSPAFPLVLFTQTWDFLPRMRDPSAFLLSLSTSFSIPTPEVAMDPDLWTLWLSPTLSPGSSPFPVNCTHGAGQTIWFPDRSSNPGHSYSHSVSGLCKNPKHSPDFISTPQTT